MTAFNIPRKTDVLFNWPGSAALFQVNISFRKAVSGKISFLNAPFNFCIRRQKPPEEQSVVIGGLGVSLVGRPSICCLSGDDVVEEEGAGYSTGSAVMDVPCQLLLLDISSVPQSLCRW